MPAFKTRMPFILLAPVLALAVLAAALVAAPGAHAYRSDFTASPAYPESTLAMKVKGRPRARGLATLEVTGSNASREDGDGLAFDYTLDVFVQDRKAFADCAESFGEQRNRIVDVPDKVEHIGNDLDEGSSGPFEVNVTYRTESFRRLMFCAYTSYVVDDVAVSRLKHNLRKRKRR